MIRHVLFDFDGVILDSMPIREAGFRELYPDLSSDVVDRLVAYHRANGGLSRYAKIRYFHREVLGHPVSEDEVNRLAARFSSIVKDRLCDRSLLIAPTVRFVEANHARYDLHVVSGSDGEELREVCVRLDLSRYFRSIHGSPTPKNELVAQLVRDNRYEPSKTVLVGDSMNDLEAARGAGIGFYGFNNDALRGLSDVYVDDYERDFR